MLCHKNPKQINKLIDALLDDDIDIYIHVDKKSNIVNEINSLKGIYVLPEELRVNVKWATFSMVQAELNLIYYSFNVGCYDYFWLISGEDYPIVSTKKILRKLVSNPKMNYINLVNSKNFVLQKRNNYDKRNDIYYPDWILNRGYIFRIIRRIWVEITGGYNYTFRFFKRRDSIEYSFYYGSQWWCLSRYFIEYTINYLNRNPSYIDIYHNSSCPDESFFQTILMNSRFRYYRSDYLHYIDWSQNMNSPKALTVLDIDNIYNSKKLMARKIDANYNADLIYELDLRRVD